MKTIRNLAAIVTIALINALLQWLLGDSVWATFGFFLAVFVVLVFGFGTSGWSIGVKGWSRLVLTAVVATAAYTAYESLLPADSAWKMLLLVLLTAAVLGPIGWEAMRKPRHS